MKFIKSILISPITAISLIVVGVAYFASNNSDKILHKADERKLFIRMSIEKDSCIESIEGSKVNSHIQIDHGSCQRSLKYFESRDREVADEIESALNKSKS